MIQIISLLFLVVCIIFARFFAGNEPFTGMLWHREEIYQPIQVHYYFLYYIIFRYTLMTTDLNIIWFFYCFFQGNTCFEWTWFLLRNRYERNGFKNYWFHGLKLCMQLDASKREVSNAYTSLTFVLTYVFVFIKWEIYIISCRFTPSYPVLPHPTEHF